MNRYVFFLGIIALVIAGCSKSSDFEPLQAKIILPATTLEIKKSGTVFFESLVSGGVPPYTYLWHFDGGASDCTGQNTGEIVFNYEGDYTTSLTVTDGRGSAARDEVRIIVTPSGNSG